MTDLLLGRKKDPNRDKIYTIKRRISAGKVEVADSFDRGQTISADTSFRVGDEVLVVSGVLVGSVGKLKVTNYEV